MSPERAAYLRDLILADLDELHRLLTVSNFAQPEVLRESWKRTQAINDRLCVMTREALGPGAKIKGFLIQPTSAHPAPKERTYDHE